MPRMNGRELARALLQARPSLKVLFMSGYARLADESAPPDESGPVLRKPFSPGSLLSRVRAILDGVPPEPP
jgi:DNA-binding response OmpR family regulator